MSDMEAVKAHVRPLEGVKLMNVGKALNAFTDQDARYEWMYENQIFLVNGILYEAEVEKLDAYGFIDKKLNEDGSVDITALFYNGGTCIGEIIEEALRENE